MYNVYAYIYTHASSWVDETFTSKLLNESGEHPLV